MAKTPRAYKIPKTQQHIGFRPTSAWGDGELLAPWAVGDIVDIPAPECEADRRGIPHSWSAYPEICKLPGRYVVTTAFSIGEGDEWYFRVSPMRDDGYTYDESSDRQHMIPGSCNRTERWTLVK